MQRERECERKTNRRRDDEERVEKPGARTMNRKIDAFTS